MIDALPAAGTEPRTVANRREKRASAESDDLSSPTFTPSQSDMPRAVPVGVALVSGAVGVLSVDPKLRPGDAVGIATGSFAGLVGHRPGLDPNDRVDVPFEVMGAGRQVTVASRIGSMPAA